VLEDREFYPVGSTDKRFVDVRFIAATNQDLETLIDKGRFRKDLYYRVNVIPVEVPPLRERTDDIPLLAGFFLNRYSKRYSKDVRSFSEEALAAMAAYPWPGNVRELENCVQRAILAAQDDVIGEEALGAPVAGQAAESDAGSRVELVPGLNLEEKLQEMEKLYIEKALVANGYNLTNAAKALGMSFRAIRYKIKKYGISTSKEDN
jgi:DNA-binding NtrC family response regulator